MTTPNEIVAAAGCIALVCAALALRGGDSKPPQPTYTPVPPGRYKPEATAMDPVLLAAAKGVERAQ